MTKLYKVYNEFPTPAVIVQRMCDNSEPQLSDPTKKVLEPSCGTGTFLVETLRRRLQKTHQNPIRILLAVSNLYGVDIRENNITETRQQLRTLISKHLSQTKLDYRFWPLIDAFLQNNLLVGDFINCPNDFTFVDWQPVGDYEFKSHPVPLTKILES